MSLKDYERKRSFEDTPEPRGSLAPHRKGASLLYVVQKHLASHLHYDFRLEWNGVLLSWAIPKGPSLDPSVKRLAMQVEDHPVEYGGFEGVIPAGQYGAGTVMLWDTGTWVPDDPNVDASLHKGELKFTLHGRKLMGAWVLVRTRGFGRNPSRSSWLLIKHSDQHASTTDITAVQEAGGDVDKARKGDSGGNGSPRTLARPASGIPARKRKA